MCHVSFVTRKKKREKIQLTSRHENIEKLVFHTIRERRFLLQLSKCYFSIRSAPIFFPSTANGPFFLNIAKILNFDMFALLFFSIKQGPRKCELQNIILSRCRRIQRWNDAGTRFRKCGKNHESYVLIEGEDSRGEKKGSKSRRL